jgi:GNAT superfamily N-acetyltransferase
MGALSQERTSDTAPAPAVEVTRADQRHLDSLAEFIRRVWDPTATFERVRRARAEAAEGNPVEPGRDIPTFLFLHEGRVVGHVSTIPVRVWQASGVQAVHWVKGLEVLPEYQNGPVGFLVLKHAVHELGPALSLAVRPAAHRLLQAVGFRDLGAVPNFLLPLSPARMLQRLDLAAHLPRVPRALRATIRLAQRTGLVALAGAAAGAATRLWAAAASGPSRPFRTDTPVGLDPDECDDLWRRVRGQIHAGVVRDGRYLRWRYGRASADRYRFVTVRDRGELVGIGALREPRSVGDPRLHGIRVATLSDLLCPPDRPGIALATLAAAATLARSLGADALLCTASHRSLAGPLRRRGFVRLPGNVHFLVREPAGDLGKPPALADWWITRGDSEADEVF